MTNNKVVIVPRSANHTAIQQQEKELITRLNGKITDMSGNPLPGVTITIKGTTLGTATDLNGAFTMELKNGTILEFRSVGMKTLERIYKGESTLAVKMEEEIAEIEERSEERRVGKECTPR